MTGMLPPFSKTDGNGVVRGVRSQETYVKLLFLKIANIIGFGFNTLRYSFLVKVAREHILGEYMLS